MGCWSLEITMVADVVGMCALSRIWARRHLLLCCRQGRSGDAASPASSGHPTPPTAWHADSQGDAAADDAQPTKCTASVIARSPRSGGEATRDSQVCDAPVGLITGLQYSEAVCPAEVLPCHPCPQAGSRSLTANGGIGEKQLCIRLLPRPVSVRVTCCAGDRAALKGLHRHLPAPAQGRPPRPQAMTAQRQRCKGRLTLRRMRPTTRCRAHRIRRRRTHLSSSPLPGWCAPLLLGWLRWQNPICLICSLSLDIKVDTVGGLTSTAWCSG